MRSEGYRYIREYRVGEQRTSRYALHEVQQGKARRVGTAQTEAGYLSFLFREPENSPRVQQLLHAVPTRH